MNRTLNIRKHTLPFGDYVKCKLCGEYWNTYVSIFINEKEIVICPDCFKKFRYKINKLDI